MSDYQQQAQEQARINAEGAAAAARAAVEQQQQRLAQERAAREAAERARAAEERRVQEARDAEERRKQILASTPPATGTEAQQLAAGQASTANRATVLGGRIELVDATNRVNRTYNDLSTKLDITIAQQQEIVNQGMDTLRSSFKYSDPTYIPPWLRPATDNLAKLKGDKNDLAKWRNDSLGALSLYNTQLNLVSGRLSGPTGVEYVIHPIVVGGETKYTVTYMIDGESQKVATFNTLQQARNFESELRRKDLTNVTRNPQEYSYYVDAPGMEGYVAGLNIPISTQSGVDQQGWVDARIDLVAGAIRGYGIDLETRARLLKLGGYDAWAGVYASGAVAAGVASALFGATAGWANPLPKEQAFAVEDFANNPMFATGYVGGNVALILYGASGLYGKAAKRLPKIVKDWAKDPDTFIDIAHEGLSQPRLKPGAFDVSDVDQPRLTPFGELDERMNPVATEWPEGSVEFGSAYQRGTSPTAYAMLELDDPSLSLPNLYNTGIVRPAYLSIDYPIYRYGSAASMAQTSSAALMEAALVAAGASALLQRIRLTQPEVAVVNVGAILASDVNLSQPIVSSSELEQVSLLTPLSVVDVKTISEAVPWMGTVQEPVSGQVVETIPVLETVTVQEPVVEVPPPTPQFPELPDFKPPTEEVVKVRGLGDDEAKRGGRGPEVKRGPRFRVVLDSKVSVVEASGFVEALSRVSGGRGSRATVTRLPET